MTPDTAVGGRGQTASNYDALMKSARSLFSQKGYAAVGIREIASKAGVTIGTLYYYAPSKEGLFLRLVVDSYTVSTKALQAAVDQEDDFVSKLKALVASHIMNEVHDHDLWTLAMASKGSLSPEGKASFQAARDKFEDVWRSVIDGGVESGEFRIANPKIARMSLIKICNGVADWFNPAGELTLSEVSDVIFAQALAVVEYSGVTPEPNG